MDATGGSNYTLAGTTQILSVPYAQYAKNSTPQTLTVTGNSLAISGGNTVTLPAGGGGKTFVTISGDMTNAQASAKLATEGGVNTQVISVLNCSELTSLDLSAYTNLYSLSVKGNTALTSITLTGLKEVASDLIFLDNQVLSTLNFPALTYCGQGMEISSNNALTAVNAGVLKSSGGQLAFYKNEQLSNISFSNLINTEFLYVQESPALTTLSIANLKTGGISIGDCPLFSSLSVPVWAGDNLEIKNTNISTLSAPMLVKSIIYIANNTNLTTISMAKLVDAGINLQGNNLLSTVSLPMLTSASFSMYGSKVSTLSLPAFTTIKATFIFSSPLLTSISLPALTTFINGAQYNQINIGSNLNTAAVNALLAKFVAITPIMNGVPINLQQSPSAPPTGQGLTDKATLISRGNTVSTN